MVVAASLEVLRPTGVPRIATEYPRLSRRSMLVRLAYRPTLMLLVKAPSKLAPITTGLADLIVYLVETVATLAQTGSRA